MRADSIRICLFNVRDYLHELLSLLLGISVQSLSDCIDVTHEVFDMVQVFLPLIYHVLDVLCFLQLLHLGLSCRKFLYLLLLSAVRLLISARCQTTIGFKDLLDLRVASSCLAFDELFLLVLNLLDHFLELTEKLLQLGRIGIHLLF